MHDKLPTVITWRGRRPEELNHEELLTAFREIAEESQMWMDKALDAQQMHSDLLGRCFEMRASQLVRRP